MDANFFSLKSQTLAVVTASTPSLSSFISPTLRPQFLRPANTSRMKKCNKLGLLHTRASPQLLVRASLDSDSNSFFIVVAFATFTAVAYFNHFLKISRTSSKEVSQHPSILALIVVAFFFLKIIIKNFASFNFSLCLFLWLHYFMVRLDWIAIICKCEITLKLSWIMSNILAEKIQEAD